MEKSSLVDGKKNGPWVAFWTALWILGVVIKWVKEMANGRATWQTILPSVYEDGLKVGEWFEHDYDTGDWYARIV